MQEMKDTAIKLFGRTIPLLLSDRAAEGAAISGEDSAGVSHTCGGGGGGGDGGGDIEDMMKSSDYDRPSMIVCSEEEDEKKKASEIQEKADNKDLLEGKSSEIHRQDDAPQRIKGDSTTQETFKETNENPRTPSIDVETATINISKTEKEQNDTTDSQEKTLQKPDKIIPCPRCNSMDTKFCYYNNYNVHQPRYFCKSCQRYWTAGGNMRNVPVGAGRRKNKNAAISHYGHITISEAVHAARIDAPNGVHHPALKCNGTVLRFGSDASLSNSVASALNLSEKPLWNGTRNGFHKMEEQRIQDPSSVRENGDNHSCGSSVTATNSTEEGSRNCAQQTFMPNFNGFAPPIQCLPGVPWPYPWNSGVPPPAFCPPGMPISFYPAGYWNCTIPGTWNVPWIPSPNQNAQSPGPNSQTLGKHSRDADVLEPEKEEPQRQKNSESCIWIPKTLRIDDPEEAAKSSIWTTLGIKNESISKGGLFKAFQPKTFEKNHVAESSPALRANPAALSRSINFHESS